MKKNLFLLLAILIFVVILSFFRGFGKTFYRIEPLVPISNQLNSDLRGKNNKIIYFWTTWCSVCQSNLPLIKFSYRVFENRLNTKFFTIDDGSNGINFTKQYIEKNEIEFPVFMGTDELYKKNFVTGFPTILFLNEEDKVIFSDTGIITPVGIFLRMLFVYLTNV